MTAVLITSLQLKMKRTRIWKKASSGNTESCRGFCRHIQILNHLASHKTAIVNQHLNFAYNFQPAVYLFPLNDRKIIILINLFLFLFILSYGA